MSPLCRSSENFDIITCVFDFPWALEGEDCSLCVYMSTPASFASFIAVAHPLVGEKSLLSCLHAPILCGFLVVLTVTSFHQSKSVAPTGNSLPGYIGMPNVSWPCEPSGPSGTGEVSLLLTDLASRMSGSVPIENCSVPPLSFGGESCGAPAAVRNFGTADLGKSFELLLGVVIGNTAPGSWPAGLVTDEPGSWPAFWDFWDLANRSYFSASFS